MDSHIESTIMRRDQKRSNRQIGITLGVIAMVFFFGCIARMALLGR